MQYKEDYLLIQSNNGTFPALFQIVTGEMLGSMFMLNELKAGVTEEGTNVVSYEYVMVDPEGKAYMPSEDEKSVTVKCIDNFIDVLMVAIEGQSQVKH